MKWIEPMKKMKILLITIFSLIVIVLAIKISVNTRTKKTEEDTQDVLYQDVINSTLIPTIDKALVDYYKNILTETPFYDSTLIKIIDIERPNGNRTWYFIINIEIEPFIGPHITVGKDRISKI